MAEENKLNIFDVNNESDDIQESISNANKVTDDVVKKAAEKIAERRKENLRTNSSTWFKSVSTLRNPQHCSYAVVTA